ncbi:hypothetical protein ACPA9J_05745 [Pseudomonas aeruginosa]
MLISAQPRDQAATGQPDPVQPGPRGTDQRPARAACCCRASSTSRNRRSPQDQGRPEPGRTRSPTCALGQFELNQERDKLATPQQHLDDLLAQQPSEQVTPELRKDLDTLLATRSELLGTAQPRTQRVRFNEAITLQLNQKQLLSTSESLRTTLDEQMFWIPSNQPPRPVLVQDDPDPAEEPAHRDPLGLRGA